MSIPVSATYCFNIRKPCLNSFAIVIVRSFLLSMLHTCSFFSHVALRPTTLKFTIPGRFSMCNLYVIVNSLSTDILINHFSARAGKCPITCITLFSPSQTSLPEQLYTRLAKLYISSPTCSTVFALSLPVTRYTSLSIQKLLK